MYVSPQSENGYTEQGYFGTIFVVKCLLKTTSTPTKSKEMFKKITLISLSIIACLSARAQVAFPSGEARWTERRGNGEAPHTWFVMQQRNEVLTILGTDYKKLYAGEFNSTQPLIGGLRADAANRVYYYNLSTGVERKVYDFSMVVGDTLKNWGVTELPIGVVHSVDTVTIAGVARKRINFRQLTDTARWTLGAWVEGIGNVGLGGLLGNPMMQPTCDCGVNTLCLSFGDTNVYHNPAYATLLCEPELTKTENIKSVTNIPQLYPNPINAGSRYVQLMGAEEAVVHLYDMLGRLVCRANMRNNEGVQLPAINTGIYTYTITTPTGKTTTGRVVVGQ